MKKIILAVGIMIASQFAFATENLVSIHCTSKSNMDMHIDIKITINDIIDLARPTDFQGKMKVFSLSKKTPFAIETDVYAFGIPIQKDPSDSRKEHLAYIYHPFNSEANDYRYELSYAPDIQGPVDQPGLLGYQFIYAKEFSGILKTYSPEKIGEEEYLCQSTLQ